MATSAMIPEPPAGFELDNQTSTVPPPPDGFEVDAPAPPKIQLDPYQRIVAAGQQHAMEEGKDDFLRSVASDPVGFIKSLPGSAMSVASSPGRVAYLGAADAISKAFSQPEYGGNLAAADRGESILPVDKFIGQAAATNPRLALASKLAEGAPELASMMAVNPSGTAGKLIAAGFSADMIYQAKPLFDAYATELAKPVDEQDPAKLNDLKAQVVQTFVMAPLAGAHAFGDGHAAQNARDLAKALDATRPNVPTAAARPEVQIAEPPAPPEGFVLDAPRELTTAPKAEEISAPKTTEPAPSAPPAEPGRGNRVAGDGGSVNSPGGVEQFQPARTTVAEELKRNARNQPPDFTPQYEGQRAGNGWDRQLNMSNNAAAALRDGKIMERDLPKWVAGELGIPDRAVTKKVVRFANVEAQNIFPEYHHVGAAVENFYDPEMLRTQPKFWLGISSQLNGKSHQLAAKQKGLEAFQKFRNQLIKSGDLGTWSTAAEHKPAADALMQLEPKWRYAVKNGEVDFRTAALNDYAERQPYWRRSEEIAIKHSQPGSKKADIHVRRLAQLREQIAAHPANRFLGKANAPVAEGVAGIKTSLETQSQSGGSKQVEPGGISAAPPQADKSNVADLRPEVGSALTGQVKPQISEPVKPGNRVAGEGSAPRSRPQPVPTPQPVAATPAPAASPLRQWFSNQATGVKSLVGPQAISPEARGVGNALRHFMGENALAMARADESLKSFRKEFDTTPVPADWTHDPAQPLPHNYAVIDALERDPSQLPPRYQELAKTFRDEFDWRIKEIQKFAPNALQHLIENYFPHIWQDPMRAKSAMAQVSTRLFAGRKEFLKQRTLPFFADGLAQGLKPISDNPVDLLIAKMHSMDKFLLALKAQDEFKASGAMKFKYIFDPLPEGWRVIDDPAFTVQKPPTVKITEAFDRYQREKLGEALRLLGVNYNRVASLGGQRWAEAREATGEIVAKIGSHEPTLWHELGHHLDWKFPELRQLLSVRGKSPIAQQLRKIADLRAEGTTPSASHQKYLRKTEEKMAELVRAYVHAPDLMRTEAPDVYRTFDKWLDTQPQLKSIFQDMRRGRLAMGDETTQVDLGGMLQLGHWIMPDGPAQVIQNYLSPGMSRFAPYRSFKAASNILNAAQLGLSGFHLGFTSLDAATSRLAIGIEDLSRGKVLKAAKTFASVPASPVTNILQGRRMLQEALHPGSTDAETAQLVKALEQAGGRIGQDRFWQTDFARRLKRAWHEGTATGYLKTLPLASLSAIEVGMKPIMEYVVPRQKLGVFADMARRELERLGPDASVEATREAMRKAWDSVDNRMGQVVYDNLFYNRMVKDLALASFRAYGWQLGKYREGFGAISDTLRAAGQAVQGKRPEVSHRMAYALALPIMVGAIGGTLNYLMTGQRPNDWKDYFMPRTGERDANGNPARLHLPSYLKDVIAYAKHPITSVGHSLNPMFSVIGDLLSNKDFYDTQIRNPDDPLWQQGSDVAKFAAKQFIPFSLTGTQKLRELNAPLHQQILPFFGVTPVPQRITMTPAQELASEIVAANLPSEPKTKEQYDKSKLVREIVQDFRNGQNTAGRTALAQGFQTGQLNANTVLTILDKLKYTPLQFQVHHMDVPAAMRVWRVANPQERQQLTPMIALKLAGSKTLDPSVAQSYAAELKRNAH